MTRSIGRQPIEDDGIPAPVELHHGDDVAAGPEGPPVLVAHSLAMKRLLEVVGQVTTTDAIVLIQGESGTGKELIARSIHAASPRRHRRFVAINCAAIPEALIESELFGHERGAFTGAAACKPGRIELADGGTLFLDEVAELAPAGQAKLLRVLQEHQLDRLGGIRSRPVNVRIVAASNQDLAGLVRDRRFREDLYYRLNVITLRVPPLRDRPEDLLPLAEHFLWLHAHRAGRPLHGLSCEAVTLMRRHPWPGNVRELEHAIQRAVILAPGPEIAPEDLELPLVGPIPGELREAEASGSGRTLADLMRDRILATLERCGGRRSLAAKILGIDRSTLWRKLRRYGLLG